MDLIEPLLEAGIASQGYPNLETVKGSSMFVLTIHG